MKRLSEKLRSLDPKRASPIELLTMAIVYAIMIVVLGAAAGTSWRVFCWLGGIEI